MFRKVMIYLIPAFLEANIHHRFGKYNLWMGDFLACKTYFLQHSEEPSRLSRLGYKLLTVAALTAAVLDKFAPDAVKPVFVNVLAVYKI